MASQNTLWVLRYQFINRDGGLVQSGNVSVMAPRHNDAMRLGCEEIRAIKGYRTDLHTEIVYCRRATSQYRTEDRLDKSERRYNDGIRRETEHIASRWFVLRPSREGGWWRVQGPQGTIACFADVRDARKFCLVQSLLDRQAPPKLPPLRPLRKKQRT